MPRKRNAHHGRNHVEEFSHEGVPSVFTCPDCSGTLFILRNGSVVQFQCRIGHRYSPESMLQAQNDNVERSLWTAVRALEEKAEYDQQMAQQLAGVLDRGRENRYMKQSREALQQSKVIREVIDKTVAR